MKKTALLVLMGCACAASTAIQKSALNIGRESKRRIDATYEEWDRQARARHTACVEQFPPEKSTLAQFDECIEPFSAERQVAVLTALQELVNAQALAYTLVTEGGSVDDIREALEQADRAASYFDALTQTEDSPRG